jgi:hypothetical protein
MQKLHVEKMFWKPFYRTSCVKHFNVSMIIKTLIFKSFQMMHSIFCYINPILIKNPKNQAKKGLILYNTTME